MDGEGAEEGGRTGRVVGWKVTWRICPRCSSSSSSVIVPGPCGAAFLLLHSLIKENKDVDVIKNQAHQREGGGREHGRGKGRNK